MCVTTNNYPTQTAAVQRLAASGDSRQGEARPPPHTPFCSALFEVSRLSVSTLKLKGNWVRLAEA